MSRGNKTRRHRSFPAVVFHKGGPSGAQGNLAVEEASGTAWEGDGLAPQWGQKAEKWPFS